MQRFHTKAFFSFLKQTGPLAADFFASKIYVYFFNVRDLSDHFDTIFIALIIAII